MINDHRGGFTLVEVILFLAVTSFLVIAILAGSSLAINSQRYRDGVATFKTTLQEQYSETLSTLNGRSGAESCDSSASIGTSSQPRGTSDCYIMGKYLTFDTTGSVVDVSQVIGYRNPITPKQVSDILELQQNYTLGISTVETESLRLEWGIQIVEPGASTPKTLTLMIIISPLNGYIMTFADTNANAVDPNTLVDAGILQDPVDMCVDSGGTQISGTQIAIRIDAYAANQSSIHTVLEDQAICG